MKFMILATLTVLLGQNQAFAFNEFIGNYTYVSGPTSTIGCGDFSIRMNQARDGLDVYHVYSPGDTVLTYEFPAINKGKVDWVHDWGSGIARGKQETRYSNSQILKKVTQLGGLRRIRNEQMVLTDESLTIESSSRDHRLKCVLKKQ
jgi:hypothetical protein